MFCRIGVVDRRWVRASTKTNLTEYAELVTLVRPLASSRQTVGFLRQSSCSYPPRNKVPAFVTELSFIFKDSSQGCQCPNAAVNLRSAYTSITSFSCS